MGKKPSLWEQIYIWTAADADTFGNARLLKWQWWVCVLWENLAKYEDIQIIATVKAFTFVNDEIFF